MSQPLDWSTAFKLQAQEDLNAAQKLADSKTSYSTLCMLLQMVFEKTTKAILVKQGYHSKSHVIASRLLDILGRTGKASRLPLPSPSVQSFILELEGAHPSMSRDRYPQLEYPWEDQSVIRTPSLHLPLVLRVQNPRDRILPECMRYARALLGAVE